MQQYPPGIERGGSERETQAARPATKRNLPLPFLRRKDLMGNKRDGASKYASSAFCQNGKGEGSGENELLSVLKDTVKLVVISSSLQSHGRTTLIASRMTEASPSLPLDTPEDFSLLCFYFLFKGKDKTVHVS